MNDIIRAKYQPYDALRQQFWRQYLKQYDTDDSELISRIELTSMLDSLGSTLSKETVDSFFTKFGKRPHEDELTFNEAIRCLEEELCRPSAQKKRIASEESGVPDTSTPATPMFMNNGSGGTNPSPKLVFDSLDFSGAAAHPTAIIKGALTEEPQSKELLPAYTTEPSQQPLLAAAQTVETPLSSSPKSGQIANPERQASSSSSSDADDSGAASEDSFERVINVKNCPLCHRPRMNSQAEVDIVTHLAVCASQDWGRVDRMIVGNFVTASQAQRKWYTKVISKVSAGNYKLGAVCLIYSLITDYFNNSFRTRPISLSKIV